VREIGAEMTATAFLSQQCRCCNHETSSGCVRGSAGAKGNRTQYFDCVTQAGAMTQDADVSRHDLPNRARVTRLWYGDG